MKKKLRFTAMLAGLLAFGLIVVGCKLDADDIPSPDTPPADITYTAAQTGGENGAKDSSGIVFTFSEDVTELAAADITLTKDDGEAAAGSLSGSGKSWTLAITVQKAGTVKVKIAKSGIESSEKYVTVYKNGETLAPTYDSVTVSPATKTLAKGETLQLSATVNGRYGPVQTVTWSITTGGIATETSINSSGLLTIAVNETQTSIVVKATSTGDTSVFATATVAISGGSGGGDELIGTTWKGGIYYDEDENPFEEAIPFVITLQFTNSNQWELTSDMFGVIQIAEDTVRGTYTISENTINMGGDDDNHGYATVSGNTLTLYLPESVVTENSNLPATIEMTKTGTGDVVNISNTTWKGAMVFDMGGSMLFPIPLTLTFTGVNNGWSLTSYDMSSIFGGGELTVEERASGTYTVNGNTVDLGGEGSATINGNILTLQLPDDVVENDELPQSTVEFVKQP